MNKMGNIEASFETEHQFKVGKACVYGGFLGLSMLEMGVATSIKESDMKPLYKIVGCAVFSWKAMKNLYNAQETWRAKFEDFKKPDEPAQTETSPAEDAAVEDTKEPEE